MKFPEQPSRDRQIRVFISSTFRDMQAERDHLVKFIFPQLRKLCESRGVTWGEVDLRWGVTDEQAAEGKVLPICLEEIKRCRPYFIGLLGERYGWIPDALPDDLLEREPWLKEHLHGKTSVTELEILHGVLRNEEMHGHAFVYFRDPKYIELVPPDKKTDIVAENTEKQNHLKNLIRQTCAAKKIPLRENHADSVKLSAKAWTNVSHHCISPLGSAQQSRQSDHGHDDGAAERKTQPSVEWQQASQPADGEREHSQNKRD